jgi:SAM-dependent methyltransferase
MQELFAYAGYDIPVDLVRLTGAGPESFAAIADHHIEDLRATVGLEPSHSILEIGCGIGRDAIPLSQILSPQGTYVGVDIIKRSIDWCAANIGVRHPNFRFVHFDVKDQLHNPHGRTTTRKIKLPVRAGSVDRVILWSVFTHMFRPDIVHYLREFRRCLKSDGLVFATCFMVDPDVLAAARRTDLTPYALRFEHLHEPGCLINDPKHPLGAVAYTREALERMVVAGGLALDRPIGQGSWSGLMASRHSQDVMVLRIGPEEPLRGIKRLLHAVGLSTNARSRP